MALSAEGVTWRCSVKEKFLKEFTKLTKKTPALASFFGEVAARRVLFCKISVKGYFYKSQSISLYKNILLPDARVAIKLQKSGIIHLLLKHL